MASYRFQLISLFTTILVFSFAAAPAQKKAVRKEIKNLMEEYQAVGLSVAVVKKGKITYTQSFGWKNAEQKIPLRNSDIFRIASISKSFSATSILQLAEAGKLSLDDNIEKLIGFPLRNPAYPDEIITLRMLLSHTSSINDSEGYFTLDAINPEKNTNWAKCFSDYKPGTQYRYCNLNYNMVGAIIERISGERFDQYVTRHILQPLGLYGGYCVDSLNSSRFATIYEYVDSTKRLQPSPNAYHPRREELSNYVMGYTAPVFSPTGGMKISAPDLARYMMMHMNRGKWKDTRIMDDESARQMQTPVLTSSQYGLAIETTDKLIPGITLKGHTGSAYGLSSMMFFHPEEKFGWVLICNGSRSTYSEGYHEFLKKCARLLFQRVVSGE